MDDRVKGDGRPSVLITAVGGSGAIDVVRTLRDQDRWRIIAADLSPYAGGFHYADACYVVPAGADAEFEKAAARILEAERPDFVVTSVDEEIPVFQRLVEERFPAVRLVGPTPAFTRVAQDKWLCTRALEQIGVPVPRTWLASDCADAVLPAVVKPRTGRGSREVAYAETQEALQDILASLARDADQYIVQERIGGTEFTVSSVVALGGPLLAVVPKEVLVKRGITQSGITRRVPAIDDVCARIQEGMRADGPFNVQLMLGPDGVPYVFEINPRYSTTVSLTLASGVDEVGAILRHALGEDPGRLEFQADLLMVRHYAQIFVPERDWPAVHEA